jgi:hypothetical protein
MSTQMYLMDLLAEGQRPSNRDLMHLQIVKTTRREARAERRAKAAAAR